ncbi:thioredoxin family protein [Paenibacillus camerounensis]|uniref:thioredoxin family protein n=1 Tax=Paenibacillus camerounensis TaxID=1243663 RepID=UPI0005AB6241|nr:thioredoxin family protein [Paenibacillus camerounensis]
MSAINHNTWFDKGMTYKEYVEAMNVNREAVDRVYEQLVFTSEDLAVWNNVAKRNLRGIALTADWCGDAALNVPIVQKIAEQSNIEMRFLIRDENLELMDQYLTNGVSRAIPIFIFINESGEMEEVWGPRSPEVQDLIAEVRNQLPASDAADFAEQQKIVYGNFKENITTDPAIWRTVIESVKSKLIEV